MTPDSKSTKANEQAIIGKAMMEPDFRKRLLANPEGTLRDEGIAVSASFTAQLKSLDRKTAETVGEIIGTVFVQQPQAEVIEGISIHRQPSTNIVIDPGRYRAPTTW